MMQQIDTGYKPEFALGGLYSGMNAANAQSSNELELIKQFLENHQKQQQMPNELMKSNLEGARAFGMNTPENIRAYVDSNLGDYQTKKATGKYAQDTLTNKILQGNQEYKEKYANGLISEQEHNYQLERIKKALEGGGSAQQGGGQIGFGMQPQEAGSTMDFANHFSEATGQGRPNLAKQSSLQAFMGNDYRSPEMEYNIGLIDQEIARTKDPKARAVLQEERARVVRELGGGGGEKPGELPAGSGSTSLMNNFTQGGTAAPNANPWLQGVNMTDPRHQGVMGAFMDTPEFRRKMAEQTQRQQEAHLLQTERLAAARQVAALKQKAVTGDKTAEQALVSYLDRQVASGKMDDNERAMHLSEFSNAKFAAKVQPGTQLSPNVAPDVLVPKPQQPQVSIGSGQPGQAPSQGTTIKYDSKGNRIQ